MFRWKNSITGEYQGPELHELSDLQAFSDFQVLEWQGNGVEYNAGEPCSQRDVPGKVLANGREWKRNQAWIDKGLGAYITWYS